MIKMPRMTATQYTCRLPLCRWLYALPAAWLLAGCATNPVTGDSDYVLMSEQQEISLGQRYSREILKEMPPYEDANLNALVQSVGTRLAAHSHRTELDYRFTIVDSPTVNAFALPGGYIYITRGMLAYLNSEAELAAVLGHEIGHVTARHSVRQHSAATTANVLGTVVSVATGIQGVDDLTSMAGTAIVRGYGREHELEADRLGAQYMARSGYDPDAMLEVIGILKDQETFETKRAAEEGREPNVYHGLFSTHPENDTRLQEVVRAARAYKTGTSTRISREDFIRSLEGLPFGDSASQGIVRGSRFYHAALDFTLAFPTGWQIDNRKDRVVAMPAGKDGLMQLQMVELEKRMPARDVMQKVLQLNSLQRGEQISSDGMTGYTGIASGKSTFGTRPVRYIVLMRDKTAWIFAGTAQDKRNPYKYDRQIIASAKTFRSMNAEDAKLASGNHLHIISAGSNSHYRDLATRSPIDRYAEEQLRLLNDQYPQGEPRSGQLLKTVR
jgi:predicted Zn-dependent protease